MRARGPGRRVFDGIEGCTNTPRQWPEHPNGTVAVAVVSPDAGPKADVLRAQRTFLTAEPGAGKHT